jgi:hypothetical protein
MQLSLFCLTCRQRLNFVIIDAALSAASTRRGAMDRVIIGP